MTNMKSVMKRVNNYVIYRNRNHNHKVGDTLTYNCEYIRGLRQGKVKFVVPHHGMNYYVLEVETGPPVYETFLVLMSEFQIEEKL